MFTGLVEEMGTIASISQSRGARNFTINADIVLSDLKIDDSVAIDGTCLTVIELTGKGFAVEAVEQTLKMTTLGSFRIGQNVNLERALRADARLGGHFVQGHVDGVGEVIKWQEQQGGKKITIKLDKELMKYIIPKGSITVNGCSLTVASIQGNSIDIALIPHTLEVTTLGRLTAGDKVNIETDMLGKYAYKYMKPMLEEHDVYAKYKIKVED